VRLDRTALRLRSGEKSTVSATRSLGARGSDGNTIGLAEAMSANSSCARCLVARGDVGEIVGFAVANHSFFARCFIVLVVVQENHRRHGVASALIRAIETRCTTEKIFTSTNASNLAMQAVCDALEFVRSGVIWNLDDGDPEIVYFKRLPIR
jgi:GNAT superfamily N-acetyltransferase